jgi:hypothetical protein
LEVDRRIPVPIYPAIHTKELPICSNRLLLLLPTKINAGYREIVAAENTALLKAFEVGTWLISARGLLRHGQWLEWLERTDCGQANAYNYIKIAENEGVWRDLQRAGNLSSIRGALGFNRTDKRQEAKGQGGQMPIEDNQKAVPRATG